MGWWTNPAGGQPVNLGDGYDETQGKMNDSAWDGSAPSATIVSILKRMAAGGGGSAVTIADGADVAQGTKADAAWVAGDGTVISLLKKIASAGGSAVSVADGADVAQGTTTDASSANTVIGLLKNIKAALAGTLTVGSHNVTNAGTFAVQADTELPAAAALADAAGNPTAPATGAFGMLWNGASWDRAPGTAAAGMKVQSGQLPAALAAGGGLKIEGVAGGVVVPIGNPSNLDVALSTRLKPADTLAAVTAITNAVHVDDNAGSLTVDAPVGTPAFVRLSDGAAAIATLPVSIAATQAVNEAQVGGTATDTNSGNKSAGTQRVVLATDQPALTNALKVDGSAVTQPVSGTVKANVEPETAGGLTIGPASGAKLISAATTNATSVKASAGQVYGWYIYNANAAVRYLKLYNKASSPTVGTDVPVMVIPIPPGAAANVEFTNGIAFGTGIALALTTGVADADTGAVAANEIVVNLLFK
jgi:hypothetical protein